MAAAMMPNELARAPSPEFEAVVTTAGSEAIDAKKCAETLAAAARLASKGLNGCVDEQITDLNPLPHPVCIGFCSVRDARIDRRDAASRV